MNYDWESVYSFWEKLQLLLIIWIDFFLKPLWMRLSWNKSANRSRVFHYFCHSVIHIDSTFRKDKFFLKIHISYQYSFIRSIDLFHHSHMTIRITTMWSNNHNSIDRWRRWRIISSSLCIHQPFSTITTKWSDLLCIGHIWEQSSWLYSNSSCTVPTIKTIPFSSCICPLSNNMIRCIWDIWWGSLRICGYRCLYSYYLLCLYWLCCLSSHNSCRFILYNNWFWFDYWFWFWQESQLYTFFTVKRKKNFRPLIQCLLSINNVIEFRKRCKIYIILICKNHQIGYRFQLIDKSWCFAYENPVTNSQVFFINNIVRFFEYFCCCPKQMSDIRESISWLDHICHNTFWSIICWDNHNIIEIDGMWWYILCYLNIFFCCICMHCWWISLDSKPIWKEDKCTKNTKSETCT